MAQEQVEGNKVFYCPSCAKKSKISALIGFQPYRCPTTGFYVTIQEQLESFQKRGWEVTVGGKEKQVHGS